MDVQPLPGNKQYVPGTELALFSFFESAPLMMGIVDVEGDELRHVADNKRAIEFFGMRPGETCGKLAGDLGVRTEFINLWLSHYLAAKRTRKPVKFEYRHAEKIFSVIVTHLMDLGPQHSRFSYIVNDITDTSKELQLQKNKFDCLLQSAPVGIAFVDKELRYEIINPFLASMNGLSPSQHIGRRVKDVLPHGADFISDQLRLVLRTGQKLTNWEYTFEDKTYIANYFPVKLDGEVIGVGATVTEITDRKFLELDLLKREADFREIANIMPQIVWTARPDGFVDWYNDWWYKYTGARRGTNWDEAGSPMHPDDIQPTHERWMRSLETGTLYEMEYRFRRASDGEYRWHLGRATPVKNEKGEVIRWIGSNTDIHDQKTLLSSLQNERGLRENFVATLSHDLRTPLTAARMSAQIIQKKVHDPDTILRTASRIVENMDRADQMIKNLLDVSRLRMGEKIVLERGHCDLNQIVTDTLQDLATIHGDNFIFRAGKNAEGHWSCQGIRRIVENLATNAVKYGSKETPITVSTEIENNICLIRVHNMGNPIPMEDLSCLFEPYQRLKRSHGTKGWGLGLTLVKGLTEAHGGTIEVESSAEKGTTFTVRLPLGSS